MNLSFLSSKENYEKYKAFKEVENNTDISILKPAATDNTTTIHKQKTKSTPTVAAIEEELSGGKKKTFIL